MIMTSNLGTAELNRPTVGFVRDSNSANEAIRLRSSIEDALKKTFRPEFLNRVDEIIIFDPLTSEEIQQIVDLMVKEVESRLLDRGVTISLTDPAREWLAKEGFDSVYGARPTRRAIQRFVENPLSKAILAGEFGKGDHVVVEVGEGELTFKKAAAPPGEKAAAPVDASADA